MRKIKYTSQFKKDYKRQKKVSGRGSIDDVLIATVKLLVADKPLPKRYCDHALNGNWKDHRDCHIKPDLILIYRKPAPASLELVRIGSHSQLGL